MASLKSDCRKFAPNIFNKTKCQNCFRGKDVHSAEALESNRATRKVCLCGYLFVAPDWDFSLPANRNKRWQRRWFVLYDDGELAYSVDECPETVPQAVIDMNCVLEVTDAENITGNQFALAITLPEKVHFVKGTNKEEIRKWFEVLSRFPRNTVCGKYKRNATFPGVKAISSTKTENNFTDWVNRRETVQVHDYPKTNGYISRNSNAQNHAVKYEPEDVIPTKDTNCSITANTKSCLEENRIGRSSFIKDKVLTNCKVLNKEPYSLLKSSSGSSVNTVCQKSTTRNVNSNSVLSPSSSKSDVRDVSKDKLLQGNESCRKYVRNETKENRRHHSRSDISHMIPSTVQENGSGGNRTDWKRVSVDVDRLDCNEKNYIHNPVYMMMADVPSGKKVESFEKYIRLEKPHVLQRQSSFGRRSELIRQASSWINDHVDGGFRNRTIHKSASVPNAVISEDDGHIKSNTFYNSHFLSGRKSRLSESKYLLELSSKSSGNVSLERGDPDGCNLDSMPSICSFSNDQNSETLSLKKGWLVKQDHSKWNKHWFVLRNSALTFYSDPIAEDAGILDGVVDLRKVQSVSEVQSNSGHTFCIMMKDNSKLFLSAVTAKMRNNWIRAILHVAKLKSITSEDNLKKTPSTLAVHAIKESLSSSLKRNPSVSSADSENVSIKNFVPEDEDQDHHRQKHHHGSVAPLPPSPPLTRTVISRVKERARSRSHSRSSNSRFNSTEIHESDPSYLADSDDGTTDHSSSSLSNTPVSLKKEEEKPVLQETPITKRPEEKSSKPERRRSLKLSGSDVLPYPERRKKVLEIKDKLEDSSWTIWLDISKFCKEVEAKLDDIEKSSSNRQILQHPVSKDPESSVVVTDKKKETGHLAVCLMKVEKRLHKVHSELEKAKVDLLLSSKEKDLETSVSKSIPCHTSVQCDAEVSGMSPQNIALTQQLTKLKEEHKRLKQDLKSAQATSDTYELNCISLKQELKQKTDLHGSQMDLMVARVDDLTTKLLNSEKNVRMLRQRVMKLEQRQERRRSSLKGKEAISLSKEYEAKLSELEQKISAVEVALKPSDDANDLTNENAEKSPGKETPNLLMRLHNLDKKVKDVTEIFDQSGAAEESANVEDFAKPKICLQVKLDENATAQDACDDWNSLSLSTSMTDLTNPELVDEPKNENLALSFQDCLENLNYKLTSLVSWLKTNLQLMYDESGSNNSSSVSSNAMSTENSRMLKRVIDALDHVSNAISSTNVIRQDVDNIAKDILFKIVLLQEITNVAFRMSNFEKYKAVILTQHLLRVRQTIFDLEQYLAQKSNSVNVGAQKISLCNIVANFLFYRASFPPQGSSTHPSVEKLCQEVESCGKKVSSTIYAFKEKFLQNFCATILELSENCSSDKPASAVSSSDGHSDVRPVGQKQFLSHINHIITQVSHSFVSHISKSLNEIYFLCPIVQYSTKWTSHICKLLQEELVHLSAEIKSICVTHLESDFYSGTKCGVLMEYMHCSIWELSQIISLNSLVEGTIILVKDAVHSDTENQKELLNLDVCSQDASSTSEDMETFHRCLLQRVHVLLSNLPFYPYFGTGWSFCNAGEVNVAHRSISSLLCFRQKLKNAMENERRAFQSQINELNLKISSLQEEQKKRDKGGCRTCVELRQEVSYLQAELDESQAIARSGSICEKCCNLKLEIQKLMEQHERDTFVMQKLEEQENKLKKQMQDVLDERETYFNEERNKFENDLQSAQQMLRNMENRYNEDMHSLQSLYEQKLSLSQNDVWRSRYISEIDQLKTLCEKGLEAMEAAHRKLIAELEQKHRKELDDLTFEREKVLADEAHATAVALEAVRKAHKEELQRQVQLFKDEFMKKMTARFETESFRKCYESEMSRIKQEMLAITEKYSNKCLENITLQENIEKMAHELNLCNSQVVELKARNKQLQARLTSDSMQKLEELV